MDALAEGLEQLGIVTLLRNNPILAELYCQFQFRLKMHIA